MKRTLIVVDMQNDFVTGQLGTEEAIRDSSNLLCPIFRDGELLEEQSMQEIRARLHGGKF